MFISYFDDTRVTEKALKTNLSKLSKYRAEIALQAEKGDTTKSEYSLFYPKDYVLHETLEVVKKQFKNVKHVIVIGIGGSSLGVEAIHAVLDTGSSKLTVLDTVSAHNLDLALKEASKIKKVTELAVCVISKSGKTTETLTNAAIVLEALKETFGEVVYKQTIFIGDPGSEGLLYGKKKGSMVIEMPKIIGGRYSVATAVGLVPLTLLGHDTDEFISGYLDAAEERFESIVAESASRLALYHQFKYHHYNFFAFEPRLEKLGRWYRQLFAESLGKETKKDGKKVPGAMVPTISTPVELHSVGQLYMSGVPETLTDFVTFDDEQIDAKVPKSNKLAGGLKGLSMQEIATGLYGGVVSAYEERSLPYRATIFEEELAYSLGLFMGMRLREVMYTAHLLNVDAFDQPNVELYKTKTKQILGL